VSLIKDYDVEVDLQEEGFPMYRCSEIGQRLGYLDARLEVRAGRTVVDLRVRAIDEKTARAYARRRVAMELSA